MNTTTHETLLALTDDEKTALRFVDVAPGNGCDVFSPALARTLRDLSKHKPTLVTLTEPMGGEVDGVRPYFGAIITANGRKAAA
jgi:hypothetical protein